MKIQLWTLTLFIIFSLISCSNSAFQADSSEVEDSSKVATSGILTFNFSHEISALDSSNYKDISALDSSSHEDISTLDSSSHEDISNTKGNSVISDGEASSNENSASNSAFFKTSTHIVNDTVMLILPQLDSAPLIRCTTDGSTPTSNSQTFSDSITIEESGIIRCAGFRGYNQTTPIASHTFIIGNSTKMPIVSITVDPSFLSDYYINNKSTCAMPCKSAPYWEDIEFPVHIEYFSNGSQSTQSDFEIDAGISFAGNYSRWWAKKSVGIRMRSIYQEGKFHYPLFDTRPEMDGFKSFLLRNNGSRFGRDFYGDAAATRILEGTGLDYQRSRQVVVFYNGKYYGIHDLREKINKHFIETNHGIDDDIVTIAKHSGGGAIKTNDESTDYHDMAQFISSHSFDENNEDNYNQLALQMDMNNFADYIAYEVYAQNDDWPHNNVRAWKAPNTLWKFIVFDIDFGFDYDPIISGFDEAETMFDWIRMKSGNMEFGQFFTALIENPKFKQKFLNRSAILLNRFFNSSNVDKAVDETISQLDPKEMDRDLKQFRRSLTFYKDGETMKTWAKQRDIDIWNEYRQEFNLPEEITLTFKAKGKGKILVEDMPIPESYTGKFFGGTDMILTAEPDAGYIFAGWDDESQENPRIVSPKDKKTYTALFK